MAEWVAMYAHHAEQQLTSKKKKKNGQNGKNITPPVATVFVKNEALDEIARADVDDKLVGVKLINKILIFL